MPRKSKDFEELLRLQKKSQTSSENKQQKGKSIPNIKINLPDEPKLDGLSDFDEQELRIGKIVGVDEEGEICEVNSKTLVNYQNYLKQHLELPFILTGIEDFDWEEYYIIGPGSKIEHSKLRKTRPSYLDTYENWS